MKRNSADPNFSPSDLIQFLDFPFASWMERQHFEHPEFTTPDPPDALAQVLARRRQEHERGYLFADVSAATWTVAADQSKEMVP